MHYAVVATELQISLPCLLLPLTFIAPDFPKVFILLRHRRCFTDKLELVYPKPDLSNVSSSSALFLTLGQKWQCGKTVFARVALKLKNSSRALKTTKRSKRYAAIDFSTYQTRWHRIRNTTADNDPEVPK